MFIVRVCLAQRLKGNNEVVELNLPVILCSSLRKSDIYIFNNIGKNNWQGFTKEGIGIQDGKIK